MLQNLQLSYFLIGYDTVDGRDPAPVEVGSLSVSPMIYESFFIFTSKRCLFGISSTIDSMMHFFRELRGILEDVD